VNVGSDKIACMPNFFYMTAAAIYHLGLAIWIGGSLALGGLVAPELFRQLPRPQAGGIFGPVLRRFARLRLAAIVVAIGAATWKHFAWEAHASNPWIAIRWACLTILAATVLYEVLAIEPAMSRHRTAMGAAAEDPDRVAFLRLHLRSERLMKTSLLVAVAAVLLG
jgi:uncharacterized membrane protein